MSKFKYIAGCILLGISTSSLATSATKELTFYKDLTHYKENKIVETISNEYIPLSDTAVLDTFNVSLIQDGKDLGYRTLTIHPKNEENIFKLNKNKTVFINDQKYTLVENGKGFIKVLNDKGMVTFIPKNRIESISFTNDVNATTHIAQIQMQEDYKDVDMTFSYALGEMSWKPKYDIYLTTDDKLHLDYNIEINNDSLTSFEDVKLTFMLENITRYYNEFESSNNGGLFDTQNIVLQIPNINTHQTVYDTDGYDREGYDQYGFNKSGFAKEISFSSKLLSGKRAFSLANIVDIPAKAKTLFAYKSSLEKEYEKENSFYLNVNRIKEDDYFVPTAKLTIKNKGDNYVDISNGVLRVFSNAKGRNSEVIKEVFLPKNSGSEDLIVNLDENYAIKIKVEDKKKIKTVEKDFDMLTKFQNINQRGYKYTFYAVKINIERTNDQSKLVLKSGNAVLLENASELNSIINNESNYDSVFFQRKVAELVAGEITLDKNKNSFDLIMMERETLYSK